jgi:hypothetical protein
MHDSLLVRFCERLRDLDGVTQRFVTGQWPAREKLSQRVARHELHRDEGLPFAFPDFVDLADEWMVEGGGSPGLQPETLSNFRIRLGFIRAGT